MAQVYKNYTLGRGKFLVARFKEGTQTPNGFRYMGNTPSASLSIANDSLDHFDSDAGVNEKDDSVTLQTNRTLSLTTDNINAENVALFFFGTVEKVAQSGQAGLTEVLENVKLDHSYRLGVSATNITGFFGLENVVLSDGGANPVAASGTLTFTGAGANNDTFTIGGQEYRLVNAINNPFDVLIGADAAATAGNAAAAINAGAGSGVNYGAGTIANSDVSASVNAAVVTLTAKTAGTGGNAVTLATTSAAANVSGANLTGGVGAVYVEGIDYDVDLDFGTITPKDGGAIDEDSDVTVSYGIRASIRQRTLSGNSQVEGAMMYRADNPKGPNVHYYFPYVRIAPDGDYELKGDTWQTIPLTIEILKPKSGGAAILADGVPAFE